VASRERRLRPTIRRSLLATVDRDASFSGKGAIGYFSRNLPFVNMVGDAGSSDRIPVTEVPLFRRYPTPARRSMLRKAPGGLTEQNLRNDAAIHSGS
jgi:hypothetical protein